MLEPLHGMKIHEALALGVYVARGGLNVDIGSAVIRPPRNRRELHQLVGWTAHEIADCLDEAEAVRLGELSILIEMFPQEVISKDCPGFLPEFSDENIGDYKLLEWESKKARAYGEG